MRRLANVVGIASAGIWVSSAAAQVVYSHFVLPATVSGVVASGWELGELVTFDGGALHLGTAEFQFGTFASAPNAEGTLNLNFYNDSSGTPADLFATFAQPISLVGPGPLLVTFDTGSLSVPGSVWIAVRFVQTSGGTPGVIMNSGSPTVGSVSVNRVFRNGGAGAWGTAAVSDWMTMRLSAAAAGCYANCDNSTIVPILNVNDFQCFLNKFAAGDSYANCDNSTVAPVLNVNDFQCFLNMYAAGCS